MEASSQRTWRVRLALMLIIGAALVAACMAAFMWWKAPVASAQVVASPEAVFVTRCNYSHTNTDDPIVFPGQRGAAHSHDFFANRSTKYNSTYERLRAFKGTTRATKSGTVTLSSDHPDVPPGSTMHADFFNAWDQDKLTALVESCINAYPFSPENPKPAKCRQV